MDTSVSDTSQSGLSPIGIVLIVRFLVLPVVGLLLALFLRSRAKRINPSAQNTNTIESDIDGGNTDLEIVVAAAGPRRYNYSDLAAATCDFAEENKLGRGGFGSVYHGRLPVVPGGGDGGGQQVAIKFLSESSSQGRKEFEAEVRIITLLRHRNLVQLLGWCDCPRGLMLVYELVPGGSLEKHIYDNHRLLTWSERYKIIMGLGSALRYLHQEWEQCVLHGDIKPSNIMVDSSYNTKLGDFGLARLINHGERWKTTMAVQGTAGYIDPEFINTQRPSTESDVYSFGIVLLEIACAKPPVVLHEDEPSFVLLKWVWSLYYQNTILDAADERLRGVARDERQMERVLVVGLWCAHPDMRQRPSIARAMNVLQSDDARLPDLSPQMYKSKVSPPPKDVVTVSSFSDSGIETSASTATTCSSGSFVS